MLTSIQPSRRTARPAIAVGAAVLALLTIIGTAPPSQFMADGSPVAVPTPADPDFDSSTLAELFEEMRAPETGGEGQGAVEVALAAPEIPQTADGEQGPAIPISPQAQVQPESPEPAVTPLQPSIVVRGVDPAMAAQIAAADGVADAASATVADVTVDVPGGTQTVTVAAVDPGAFRPLTPEITANESAVWDRIGAGDAAFTHDAGTRLAVPLGSTITAVLGTDEPGVGGASEAAGAEVVGPAVAQESQPSRDGLALRIGALASNGIPPVADALVSTATGQALGVDGPADVYVAVAEDADPAAVQAALATMTGAEVEELAAPETQTNTFGAFLVGSEARSFFQAFDYIDHGDGLITIDQGWVQQNIASTNMMPVLGGTVTCHRQMLIQLYGALSEVQAAGLSDLIDTSQYGGCWVARHIDFNPNKPISMHGWGLAVDMNVSTNGLGRQPTMDPRIVEIFDRWGFVWGGRWSRPDGMHFEIGAVIDVPVPEGFFR